MAAPAHRAGPSHRRRPRRKFCQPKRLLARAERADAETGDGIIRQRGLGQASPLAMRALPIALEIQIDATAAAPIRRQLAGPGRDRVQDATRLRDRRGAGVLGHRAFVGRQVRIEDAAVRRRCRRPRAVGGAALVYCVGRQRNGKVDLPERTIILRKPPMETPSGTRRPLPGPSVGIGPHYRDDLRKPRADSEAEATFQAFPRARRGPRGSATRRRNLPALKPPQVAGACKPYRLRNPAVEPPSP